MDALLRPVSVVPSQVESETITSAVLDRKTAASTEKIGSPEKCLEILKSQPDYEMLAAVLRYLDLGSGQRGFHIEAPSPLSAQIINVLVTVIVPDYWRAIKQSHGASKDVNSTLLAKCLRSVSGIGAVLARLRPLIVNPSHEPSSQQGRRASHQLVDDLLSVLSDILSGPDASWQVWKNIEKFGKDPTQRILLRKEYGLLVGSGKILAVAAQAEDVLKTTEGIRLETWLAQGTKFAAWLGRNIAHIALSLADDNTSAWSDLAQLCAKSFKLGYTDVLVAELHLSLILSERKLPEKLRILVGKLSLSDQKEFMIATLSFMSRHLLDSMVSGRETISNLEQSKRIELSASLLSYFFSNNEPLRDSVALLLAAQHGTALADSIALQRAAVAAIAKDDGALQKLMERALSRFGDQLYIKHTPILQQEVLAQTLLLSCGYVHRSQPMFLFAIARANIHMNGISNRLSASSPRARFLGMAVGMSISQLVDKPENRMNFDLDAEESLEARCFTKLTEIEDNVGNLKDLVELYLASGMQEVKTTKHRPENMNSGSIGRIHSVLGQKDSKDGGIMAIETDNESEDNDLPQYEKPDSDPEHEQEELITVRQNKPRAPVYIRDLIAGLKDTEDYDRHSLALTTAAELIRRKASFGKEVSDHADDLATVLLGLRDLFELKNFQETRQRAIIALLVAQPVKLGPWIAKSLFEGDYSVSQRITMLTAMGLGARQLAGFKDEGKSQEQIGTTPFASKTMPDKMHNIYASEASPVDSLAKQLENTIIEPMALNAADKLSGPNVLKVRTFSSRLRVEKSRPKIIPNELARLVAQNFFFPLTGRWWIHLRAYAGISNVYLSNLLLPIYLKTLAIILHASGPSAFPLPQMTSEFWELLLSVRESALEDIAALEAVLFSFLTLLDINEDKARLTKEHPKELLETQEWVRVVFDRLGGGAGNGTGKDEDERLKMLAAGVLVRCQDMVEQHQRLLLGDMMDF